MGYTLDEHFRALPASGNDAYQPVKGQSQHSYWARTMARNANYLLAYRGPQVIASSNMNTGDVGTFASCVSNVFSQNHLLVEQLRQRGRGLMLPPYTDVVMNFRAATIASPTDAFVKLYVTGNAWASDVAAAPPGHKSTEYSSVGLDFTAAHQITVTNAPVSFNRIIYIYVTMREIAKFGSWVIAVDKLS